MKCPNCGLENHPERKRCDCGYELTDDIKNLKDRVKVLEEGENIDVNERIKTCKAVSESNSKWYRHQGIVTMSILTLFIAGIIVGGYVGIKREVKKSIDDKVNNSISKLDAKGNSMLLALDEKFNSFMVKTEKEVVKMFTGIADVIPPSVLTTAAGDVLTTEAGDVLVVETGNHIVTQDKFGFENWYDMGAGAYNNKRYKKAIQYFSNALKALKEEPNKLSEAYTYYYIGIAYAQSEKHSMAIENYNKAIALNPEYPTALENKAIAYFQLKDYGNAIKGFAESSKVYGSKGNYKEALNNIRNAIEMLTVLKNTEEEIIRLQGYQEREKALKEAMKESQNEN